MFYAKSKQACHDQLACSHRLQYAQAMNLHASASCLPLCPLIKQSPYQFCHPHPMMSRQKTTQQESSSSNCVPQNELFGTL